MAVVFQEMESETVCLNLNKEENQRVFLFSQQVGRWGERGLSSLLGIDRGACSGVGSPCVAVHSSLLTPGAAVPRWAPGTLLRWLRCLGLCSQSCCLFLFSLSPE